MRFLVLELKTRHPVFSCRRWRERTEQSESAAAFISRWRQGQSCAERTRSLVWVRIKNAVHFWAAFHIHIRLPSFS